MNEGEARQKRCCGGDGCGVEIPQAHVGVARYCIGSACMAWRWDEPDYERAETHSEYVAGGFAVRAIPPDVDPAWENYEFESGAGRIGIAKWRRPKPTQRGFCGLAGRP